MTEEPTMVPGTDQFDEEDLFILRDGRMLLDKDVSEKLYFIKREHPDKPSDDDTGYEWNDMGMADLFAKVYAHEITYCPEHKTWYVYRDGAWRADTGALMVHGKLKEFVRLMTLYCGEILDDERRQAYVKFVSRMGDRRVRERIIKDAVDKAQTPAAKFDANPCLINCQNGTYDLRDFTFYEPKWDDYLTMQTNFRHTVDRDISCPRWENFINEVTEGDQEKAEYLQKALGYSLLGASNEECMFILHGRTTRNGKSTLLNTIQHMLGDYSTVSPVGLICKGDRRKDEDAPTPTIATLKGKRFVTMSESNEYGALDEERIKKLTGGEAITGRALYQLPVTFEPQFTLWLSCNDLPAVRDKSLFASDRVRVIEFNRHFNQDEQDKNLKEEFMQQAAMSGIFMWLVKGYIRYKRFGFAMPDSMRKVVRKYENDNDLVLLFLQEMCVKDANSSIKRSDVYQAYRRWCRSEGFRPLSAFKFSGEMERHPDWFDRCTLLNGYWTYGGMRLKGISLT